MDSPSNVGVEAIDEMPPSAELANAIDDACNLRSDDDPLKIDDDNQDFNEELKREAEERRILPDEPIEANEFPEEQIIEDKDDDDGYDASTNLSETPPLSQSVSAERFSTPSPLPCLEALPSKSVGRGRYGKIALDVNQQALPPPVVRDVRTVDFYSMPGNMAKLPSSYYRQRETEGTKTTNELRQPHVTKPLINFRAKFQQISIIIDKDDSKEMGFQHACRLLEQAVRRNEIAQFKTNHDTWNFGLFNYPIILPKVVHGNLLDLFPKVIDNETNRPFWFTFKRRPIFFDSTLNETQSLTTAEKDKNPVRKRELVILGQAIHAELSYGALTSMNHFYGHPDHLYRKSMIDKWAFNFRDEHFEIQYNDRLELPNFGGYKIIQVKQKITKDITDRAAIFYLWNDGFDLFLNMKGNVHKFHYEYPPRIITDSQEPNVK